MHNSKNISFGILAVCKITDSGNGHFRNHKLPAQLKHFCDIVIYPRDRDRVVNSSSRIPSFHDPTIDSELRILTGSDEPVVLVSKTSGLPSENVLIKTGAALRIVCVNFKMDNSRHKIPPELSLF